MPKDTLDSNIIKYNNGAVYFGELKIGLRHGKGRMKFKNGECYTGQWFGNKKHGFGKYSWPNGDSYEGDWKLGRMHGNGKFICSKGGWVLGEWKWNEFVPPETTSTDEFSRFAKLKSSLERKRD